MENKNNNINLTGSRIKQMRLDNCWTQKDLAQKLGLKNDTAIANYETGYSTPKDEIKLKMCELFNCSMDYLMGLTSHLNPKEELEKELYNSNSTNTTHDYNLEQDTPEIRAIARDVAKLKPEKKELFKNLLKQMSDEANEASKK